MKPTLKIARNSFSGIGLFAAVCLLPGALNAQTQTPVVNTFETNVEKVTTSAKVGIIPTVTWDVTYPSPITEVITRPDTSGGDPGATSTDTFTAKTGLTAEFKIIAADYVYKTSPLTYKEVWVQYKVNNGSWVNVFKGTQLNVNANPNKIWKNVTLKANDTVTLRFNGAEILSPGTNLDNWVGWRDGTTKFTNSKTNKSTKAVVSMVKGDIPPSYSPYFSPTGVGSYLAPYVVNGKMANLGLRDIMYTAELTNTNPSSSGFDMQDVIVLVTVK